MIDRASIAFLDMVGCVNWMSPRKIDLISDGKFVLKVLCFFLIAQNFVYRVSQKSD